MPAQAYATLDCASLFGIYEVPGSRGAIWKVTLHGESYSNCTCPSFQFFKGEPWDRTCKHMERLWNGICKYNDQWCDGNRNLDPEIRLTGYTENTIPGEYCPACNGPMVAVRRAA